MRVRENKRMFPKTLVLMRAKNCCAEMLEGASGKDRGGGSKTGCWKLGLLRKVPFFMLTRPRGTIVEMSG